jgi:PncC family amidohydrolase
MEIMLDIGDVLRTRGWRLCVAESVTIGHLQSLIGRVSGASDFFVGGITAYTLEQKVRHLGVDRNEAAATDCVSPTVCRQMARGACRMFQADLAIATTGYAEPSPELNIVTPFAFLSIYQGGLVDKEVVAKRVEYAETDRSLDRAAQRQRCQQFMAGLAIEALSEFLRNEFSG